MFYAGSPLVVLLVIIILHKDRGHNSCVSKLLC